MPMHENDQPPVTDNVQDDLEQENIELEKAAAKKEKKSDRDKAFDLPWYERDGGNIFQRFIKAVARAVMYIINPEYRDAVKMMNKYAIESVMKEEMAKEKASRDKKAEREGREQEKSREKDHSKEKNKERDQKETSDKEQGKTKDENRETRTNEEPEKEKTYSERMSWVREARYAAYASEEKQNELTSLAKAIVSTSKDEKDFAQRLSIEMTNKDGVNYNLASDLAAFAVKADNAQREEACKILTPFIEAVAADYGDKTKTAKIVNEKDYRTAVNGIIRAEFSAEEMSKLAEFLKEYSGDELRVKLEEATKELSNTKEDPAIYTPDEVPNEPPAPENVIPEEPTPTNTPNVPEPAETKDAWQEFCDKYGETGMTVSSPEFSTLVGVPVEVTVPFSEVAERIGNAFETGHVTFVDSALVTAEDYKRIANDLYKPDLALEAFVLQHPDSFAMENPIYEGEMVHLSAEEFKEYVHDNNIVHYSVEDYEKEAIGLLTQKTNERIVDIENEAHANFVPQDIPEELQDTEHVEVAPMTFNENVIERTELTFEENEETRSVYVDGEINPAFAGEEWGEETREDSRDDYERDDDTFEL